MRRRTLAAALTLAVVPGLLIGTGAGWSIARMTASHSVAGNTFTTAVWFGDTTPPTAVTIGCTDGASNDGLIQAGDTCTYTFSEPMAPASILGGWNGASTNVVVRFTNAGNNDTYAIWNASNTAQLPLGTVETNDNYVTSNTTAGASGTPSTMLMTGSTIVITLGTVSGSVSDVNGNRAQRWSPASGPTDIAGNPLTTTPVTGAKAKQF